MKFLFINSKRLLSFVLSCFLISNMFLFITTTETDASVMRKKTELQKATASMMEGEEATKDNKNAKKENDDHKPIKNIREMRSLVYELARENMKSSDLGLKGKSMGVLPSNLPTHMKERAQQSRKNEKIFGKIMNYPIEVYRSCIYPVSKINYVKWCNNVNFGHPDKVVSCELSFCNVCCDNLIFEYQQLALENPLATTLGLTTPLAGDLMKDYFIKGDKITECRNNCVKTYPATLPTQNTTPSRDPTLGTKENPARDCMDIKVWGDKDNKSGKYWCKFGFQGIYEVYCDMETDFGGWTLFFNYAHSVGQELSLNETVSSLLSIRFYLMI